MRREDTSGEPDGVWEVSCSCGYSEKFRHRADARRVFAVHSTNWDEPRCTTASMDTMHAYRRGGIDPKKTLPNASDEIGES